MEGVLINHCYGGFGFSDEFKEMLIKELNLDKYFYEEQYRDHPFVIKMFKEKGSEWISGSYSKLYLVEVPTRLINYYNVTEYDGMENMRVDKNRAIVDILRKYLKEPTSEKLEWLKEEIKIIDNLRY